MTTHGDHRCSAVEAPISVSLPVLASKPPVKKSRMSKWRAGVLIAIHVVMAAHIIQWLITGSTVSPVEPSESMYTIELGKVNAGFVLFSAALVSTLVFGRFFCGWACHIVALQDLCAHWMSKIGVRPKPFRSRLLPWWTLFLACYMFVWPAFKRHALFPLLESASIARPDWLKDVAAFPGFHSEFVVTNYWATFAPWPVAIPFLLVCGFATVYFLGSKAFCTYGCPYGGFFAPLDKLSVGRIVVSDACHQCGHCTAVCSSNVRVHEEVRQFGMVMDPGCMKCLDCVSVCPNEALSFQFAAPAVMKQRRHPADPAHPGPRYDLTLVEEVVLFGLGIGVFMGFRQMFGIVPLLMAAGLAMVTTFLLWKAWRVVRDPNVRIQSTQLKLKGRVRLAGVVFGLLTLVMAGSAAWSGYVRYQFWSAGLVDSGVTTPVDRVFAAEYTPSQEDRDRAEKALRKYTQADTFRNGGLGWDHGAEPLVRRAWLSAVVGDLDAADALMVRAVRAQRPAMSLVSDLVTLRHAKVVRKAGLVSPAPDQPSLELVEGVYREVLEAYPDYAEPKIGLAQVHLARGEPDKAAELALGVLGSEDPAVLAFPRVAAAELLISLGKPDVARDGLVRVRDRFPKDALVRASLGRVHYFMSEPEKALQEMKRATELDPRAIQYWRALEELATAVGKFEDAEKARVRAAELESQLPAVQK